MLAGKIQLPAYIVLLTEDHIYVSDDNSKEYTEEQILNLDGLFWKFRKDTLKEVDEDLGWDGIEFTGSYLIIHKNENNESNTVATD